MIKLFDTALIDSVFSEVNNKFSYPWFKVSATGKLWTIPVQTAYHINLEYK